MYNQKTPSRGTNKKSIRIQIKIEIITGKRII